MEEPVGAQVAIQIALNTLKERCKTFETRVRHLEEENLRLTVKLSQGEPNSVSVSDFDRLKAQVAELSENKLQLLNKVKMVTSENQELWSKLSRLSQVNHNLGAQLSKINDSLVQYSEKSKDAHMPLIRSKTFTQDEPQTRVLQKNIEENGRITNELEEISLKIISSFAQEKNELESLYSEIRDTHWGDNIITESCGFYYEDYDNVIEDFNSVLEELKASKETVIKQKAALKLLIEKINHLQEMKTKKICDNKTSKKIELVDKSTSTCPPEQESPAPPLALPEATIEEPLEAVDMICPVCCRKFSNAVNFQLFQDHVEKHFTDENFELL